MKNLITYLKALWSWVAGSQRKKIGVTLGEGAIEHPFSTYSVPFGTCWQPSGKLHSVVRCAAMLVMLFSIGVGNVWALTKTEGFETKTTSTTYNSTTYITTNESDCDISWTIYYGCVSTSSKLSGENSAAMRLYSHNSLGYGYLQSTTSISNLSQVSFKAKAGTGNSGLIKMDVEYSIDNGDNWSYMRMTSSSGSNYASQTPSSSGDTYTAYVPSGVTGDFLIRFSINTSSTRPSKPQKSGTNNVQLTIDDIVFTYTSACSYNVTLNYDGDASGLHGSFVLKAGSASGSTIAEGGTTANCGSGTTSVVVVPTPDTHYHVSSVSATNKTGDVSGPDGDGNYTITYTQGSNITSSITVTFEEDTKHTLTFYNNGTQVDQIQVYDGEKIGDELPTLTSGDACDATSNVFAGWTTENVGSTPVHSIDADQIVDYWTEPTADMSINALWATTSGSPKAQFIAENETAKTASELDPISLTKNGINLYYESGNIYHNGTGTAHNFGINADNYCIISAEGLVIEKAVTTCSGNSYKIAGVSDGTLSGDNLSVTDVRTGSLYLFANTNNALRIVTLNVYTYDNYITACAACAADPTEGSAALKGGFSLSSVGVTATGWDAGTNCSWTDYGFVWGTSANPTVSDNKVPVGNSGTTATWDGTLTGSFTTGITYHFRAYGKNGKDGATYQYSDDATFTPRQVSFNMHGHGGDAPANQVVNNGGKATDPGDPSEAGWTFGGWYNNDSYTGSAWVFGTNTVSGGNVTLHAKWTEKPKYTITLNAGNGTVSEAGWEKDGDVWKQQQSNGDASITFPSASSNCAGWEFVGWATSAANNVSSDPTSKAAGATLVPASNVTYYAVYRQNATGGTTYNKITSTGDLTTGDYIIISSSSYAMKNVVNSGGTYMNESSYGTFSASGSSIETSASEYIWTIVKFGSQVVIKNGTDFLGINDNNNICLSTTPHFFTYTYNTTNSRWEFTSATKTTYQLVYNSYFKMLTSQSTAIYLYKQGAGLTGNYYTNPTCSDLSITGVADPAAGGSVTLSASSVKSGEKVYAYYTEDPAYRFNSWSVSGTGASISSTTAKFTEIIVGSADVTLTANFDARVMYSVTWKANGEELTGVDLGSASTSVETGEKITTLPPAPSSCDGTSTAFVGWIAESEIWGGKTDDVSTKHIYTAASEIPAVTGAVTYHAVWAQVDSENASWKKVTSVDDLQDGETVAFISAGDGYYLPNAGSASGNAPSATAVTLTAGKINFVDAMKFTAIYNSEYDGFSFESVSATGKYLWVYNDNKGIYISATDENKSNSSNIWYLEDFDDANSTSTGYGIGMYATTGTENYRYLTTYGTSDWRSYKSTSVGTGTPANLLANIYRYADAYKQYLVKCCNTPTLAFAASPYSTIRQDINGASTTTWAVVDVTFTSNSTGTISAAQYSNATVTNGTAYQLAASKWQVYETTGGTLCGASHAYFEVLTQPSGETPGTGKFHVKTAAGQTGQGTYRIAITQAATDESHGNFCETTVYGFVDVTLRDKFVDNVNGNGTINRDGHGAQLATPTLSEFGTQDEDACHSEGRKLKGWIKETDLKAQYETGSSTRVQTVDGLCETCANGTDQTSLIVAPGANVTMSGATWYAVWAYEK